MTISRRTLIRAGIGAAGLTAAGVYVDSAAVAGRPRTGPRWVLLRRAITGDVVLPSDPGYAQAKQMFQASFDTITPEGVVYCETVQDVRVSLLFAQDHGIHTAIRSGGHNFGSYSTTEGMILDVSRLRRIEVGQSTVTLGTGLQSVDVVHALAPQGISIATGLCPTVCLGGFVQGGGIGFQTRKFGLGSDRLVSATVVLSDSRVVRCSADQHPDLYWALRGGGGGNFGVVTEFELRPTNLHRMTSFSLAWNWDAVPEVIESYLQWIVHAPDDLSSTLAVFTEDAAPGSAPASVLIMGAWLGTDPSGINPLLDELVSAVGSQPTARSVEDLPYQQAMLRLYGCEDKTADQCDVLGRNPEAMLPRHTYSVDRGQLCDRPLSRTAINEALTAFEADPRAGQFRYLTAFALGGQVSRVPRSATAFAHRDALYYFGFTVGLADSSPDGAEQAAAEAWADNGFVVADRYGTGGGYVNFPDPRWTEWRRAYYAENYPRLRAVKRRYDPHNFFRYAQSIGS